jgi:hypothetical protein
MFHKHLCGCVRWQGDQNRSITVLECSKTTHTHDKVRMTHNDVFEFLSRVHSLLLFAEPLASTMDSLRESVKKIKG